MSPHIFSLPPETLDNIVNYFSRPIDALNLSLTCRYFQSYLSPHNNFLWYRICSTLTNIPAIPKESLKAYDPTFNYKFGILRALRLFTCNFCFRYLRHNNSRRRKSDDSHMEVHGFRLCMRCVRENTITKSAFQYFRLTLEPPPRFSDVLIYSRWKGYIVTVRYFWATDIDNLCLSQHGYTLAAMKRKRETERREREEYRKANPSPLKLLRQDIYKKFYDKAWDIWLEDEIYQHPRDTFARDLDSEQLAGHLRCVADEVATEALKTVRGKKSFKQKGEGWVSEVARKMLGILLESCIYENLCYEYNVRRISEKAERSETTALLDKVTVCPISGGPIDVTGVRQLVAHIQGHHRKEFWKSGHRNA